MPAILAVIIYSKVVEVATAVAAVAGAVTAIAYAVRASAETYDTILTKDTGGGEESEEKDDIPGIS